MSHSRRKAIMGTLAAVAVPLIGATTAKPDIGMSRQGSVRVEGDDLVTEFPDGRVWRHPISTLKSISVEKPPGCNEFTIVTRHERGGT